MSLKGTLISMGNVVTNTTHDIYDIVKQKMSGFIQEAGASISGLYAGDVTGINATKVPQLQAAIDDYVKRIQDTVDEVVNQSDPNQAFADDTMRAAIKEFNEAVATVCKNYTSYLLKLRDLLGHVLEIYTKNQETMSSTLREESSSTRSSVEAYTVGNN